MADYFASDQETENKQAGDVFIQQKGNETTPKGAFRVKKQVKIFTPLKVVFLSLIINIGLVQVHFGQFWPPWTIGGVWGGSGGIWGGLQTPKMTLLLGGHFRPWNALFWVITTCLTMFLRFWVKIGPSGPKKGRFWPKQGIQKSAFFSKTSVQIWLISHVRDIFGSIMN